MCSTSLVLLNRSVSSSALGVLVSLSAMQQQFVIRWWITCIIVLSIGGVRSFLSSKHSSRSSYVSSPSRKQSSSWLRMAFDTVVSVSSKFETPCSINADAGITLSDYMKLPVDQYVCIKMPLDATLERIAGTRFNMTVPPVRFFNLDVSPTIMCAVTQSDDSVKIVSNECILRGSPYVVGLNGCFKMNIVSEFRWKDSTEKRAISSASDIYVEVDPPAPFKYFGKIILEKTGKLALSIALAQIENAFVQSLARDYERWATDVNYRVIRARGGCELPDVVAAAACDGAVQMVSSSPLAAAPGGATAGAMVEEEVDEMEGVEADIEVETVVTKQSPPVLRDDQCLLPGGDPIVRVEEAPTNSRRIFTGVDIMADMDSVWEVLTAYETLQNVVPSLVKNNVVERYPDGGARLAQVGGAKVLPGVTFTAKTVLDVRVYREDSPMPDNMLAEHLPDDAPSAAVREYDKALPLRRGIYPRPFSITSLPHRDITMQNVEGEGDFDHYQGVWRMQSLPNCAPNGGNAARLTYALEIKPKGILPVRLIEGRIASDLKANMAAIRDYVEAKEQLKKEKAKKSGLFDGARLFGVGEAVAAVSAGARDFGSAIPDSLRESSSFLDAISRGVVAAAPPPTDGELALEAAQILASASAVGVGESGSGDESESGGGASAGASGSGSDSGVEAENDSTDSTDASSSITGLHIRRRVSSLFRRSSTSDEENKATPSTSEEQLTAENAKLRERVAFLEAEMVKARTVLKQIGSLSDQSAQP